LLFNQTYSTDREEGNNIESKTLCLEKNGNKGSRDRVIAFDTHGKRQQKTIRENYAVLKKKKRRSEKGKEEVERERWTLLEKVGMLEKVQ
jgi:ribosomal silencing factor RsfS